MRKYAAIAASLLVAFVLMTVSSAKADEFNYTYTDGTVTATGTLTGTLISPGVFNITDGTIDLSGSLGGTGTLVSNPTPGAMSLSPDGLFNYNDILYPNLDPQVDYWGLLFELNPVTTPGDFVNIWYQGTGQVYGLWTSTGGNFAYEGPTTGNFAATTTPEPVSMVLMGTFLSLAGGLLGKKKRAA